MGHRLDAVEEGEGGERVNSTEKVLRDCLKEGGL